MYDNGVSGPSRDLREAAPVARTTRLNTEIADAVWEAQTHIEADKLPTALIALREALSTVTLDPDCPVPDIADAARLYAGVLISLGESYSALLYSTYAHKATRLLDKPTSLRAIQADLIHAFVLRATARLGDSVTLYRDVVQRLAQRFGPAGRPALAGRADMAVAMHAAGACKEAGKTLHRTYVSHREAFGAADPQGIRMLAKLGVMARDCGGFELAHQYFDEAKARCAQHFSYTDPLSRHVTTAARASSDPAHTCGQPATSQQGLDARNLFVNAFDAEVRDLVVSAFDLDATDPLVSAVELVTSGAPVSLVPEPSLSDEASLLFSSSLGHIGGHLTIDGSGSYPFTIDATVSNRVGLAYVQIRIFAPGADPRHPPSADTWELPTANGT
jgi:hypothetical protein